MPDMDELANAAADQHDQQVADQAGAEGKDKKPTPDAPNYVTREDFDAQRRETHELLGTVRDTLDVLRTERAPVVTPDPDPEPPAPSEDDDPDTRVSKVVARAVYRATKPLKAQIEQLAAVGLGNMASIAEEIARPQMKYYNRFKKEIDDQLSRMNPALRSRPDAVKKAHDFVVASHIDELVQEAADQSARAAIKNASPQTPSNTRRDFKAEGIPSPEDLGFSRDQVEAIEARGGPDAWARRMSGGRYKGWADYAKAHQRMRESGRVSAA